VEEKRVTIYDIAKKTGFSAVTVHRAIANKGRISEKTKQQIIEVADELGYKVNTVAQGLRRNTLKLGAILFCPVEEYVDDIIEGITAAGDELEKFNVSVNVKKIEYTSSKECLKKSCEHIRDFANDDYSGIILFMSSMLDENSELLSLVEELNRKNIVFASVANDILGDSKVLHVGINARMAGSMAAELLEFSCAGKEVALLTTSNTSPINIEYIKGFKDYSEKGIFSKIHIYEHFDDKKRVAEATRRMIEENPELKGIYMATASSTLACKYIKELQKDDLSIVITDLLSDTPMLVKQKTADAVIFQNPFKQGKNVVKHLYNYITSGEDGGQHYITPHIVFSSNIDAYDFRC